MGAIFVAPGEAQPQPGVYCQLWATPAKDIARELRMPTGARSMVGNAEGHVILNQSEKESEKE